MSENTENFENEEEYAEDISLQVEMFPEGSETIEQRIYMAGAQPFLMIEPLTDLEDGENGFKITSSLLTDNPAFLGEFFEMLSQFDWDGFNEQTDENEE